MQAPLIRWCCPRCREVHPLTLKCKPQPPNHPHVLSRVDKLIADLNLQAQRKA